MLLKPVEYKLIVEPEFVEKVTPGGIVIPENTRDAEQRAQIIGIVQAVGPKCALEIDGGQVGPGDRVYFAKYGGYIIETDDVSYRVINDEDVVCKVEV